MRSPNRDKGANRILTNTPFVAGPATQEIAPREILDLISTLTPCNQNDRQLSELIDRLSSVLQTLERPLRVGIFEGAFDPPHQGHEETARAALGIGGLDLVVVTCYPSAHEWKPNLSPHNARLEMVASCFDGAPWTVVTALDREALERLFTGHITTGIIGSDTFNRFLKEGLPRNFNTDSLFVAERRDVPLDDAPPTLHDRPVLYLGATQLAFNTTSSSKVRAALAVDTDDTTLTLISEKTALIARSRGLYAHRPLSSQISIPLTQTAQAIDHPPDLYRGCSLHPRRGLMNGLLSESFIHEVRTPTGETVAFQKALPPHRSPQINLQDEALGLTEFNKLKLSHARAPRAYLSDNPLALWVERAPGETIASLLTRYERGEIGQSECREALQVLGATLRELHDKTARPFSSAATIVATHKKEIDALVSTASSWQLKDPICESAVRRFNESSEALERTGVRCSLIHGDANCGNFLWDSASHTLWAIDLQRFGTQLRTNQPGFPSYEYHQLLSALSYFPNFGFRGLRGGGEQLLSALKEAYGAIPPAEHEFFESRWTIQRILGRHLRVIPPTLG